jgi:hypothetical protein
LIRDYLANVGENDGYFQKQGSVNDKNEGFRYKKAENGVFSAEILTVQLNRILEHKVNFNSYMVRLEGIKK